MKAACPPTAVCQEGRSVAPLRRRLRLMVGCHVIDPTDRTLQPPASMQA